jgi:hypothetical protein
MQQQEQRQKADPYGMTNKKGNSKNNGKCNRRSFDSATREMRELLRSG